MNLNMKPRDLYFVLFLSLIVACCDSADSGKADWSALHYPHQIVSSFERSGLSEAELIARADAQLSEYVQSAGQEDVAGVIRSPYYSAKVNGRDIPVYSSMVFNRAENTGTLHSFSEVYVDADDVALSVELRSLVGQVQDALVLPASHDVKAECRDGVVRVEIRKTGIYTLLFNGAGQDKGYTLFVREDVDEEAEIASYKERYRDVMVFESGVHEVDYLNFVERDSLVVYLRRGAYLKAKHLYDIDSQEDESKWTEEGALSSNAIHQRRYPFVNFYRCNHVVLAGRGAIDMTSLDRRERKGVVFNYCNDIKVSSVKIINAPEWSFITYCCRDVVVEDADIFGYRTNADGFAICNTHNATISRCFVRSADDEFEVKALGGSMDTRNVTFSDCVAWGGYARCYGICGEVVNAISDVTFRDCAVVYRDGVWDNDRIGSLVVVAEQCGGNINGVVFENIEIFQDMGRAILVKIYDKQKENYRVENILFRNISYSSPMPSKIEGNDSDSNIIQVRMENISVCGERIKTLSPNFIVGKSCMVELK